MPKTISLRIAGERTDCPVHTGAGLLRVFSPPRAGKSAPVLLVSDRAVYPLYGEELAARLASEGFRVYPVIVPRGEKAKSFHHLRRISLEARAAGLERNSPVLALGGGVVTDLAGFFASTYLRGIPLYNLSTTLLGQVDAAVGGKNGINLAGVKNQVGTFYQPREVVCDPDTLSTLPAREYRSGLAEIVKCGVIADARLFDRLEKVVPRLVNRDREVLEEAITAAVTVKARIVEADVFERSGLREKLNFGHTIGHGLESAGGNRRLRHGEAVSVGMVCESAIAARTGLFPENDLLRLRELLAALGLPVSAPGIDYDEARQAIFFDKKKKDGRLAFALPAGIGKTETRRDIPETIISACLGESLS